VHSSLFGAVAKHDHGQVAVIGKRLQQRWQRFWMRRAGLSHWGRVATRLASWGAPQYKARSSLARLSPAGYISVDAVVQHTDLRLGKHVFIGDRVTIYRTDSGGSVELGDKVQLYSDIFIETTFGGSVRLGAQTHVQPRCHFVAGKAAIIVGDRVEIAAGCAFYPFNHGMAPGTPIRRQPLESKGDIIIGDDVWLGYGVVVLDGVRIGDGAVIGAGSVVTRDIPANAVAAGAPARVLRMRDKASDADA
jgi:acetyltransferase-like isoleucine patch superfamily enzyme